ncbi:MAG: DUF1289 domain-containing protein [Deltaproteobacteria bacterium]|nr:DUF1289 domain-containing protein [Deltaproteobacteria bacterium]
MTDRISCADEACIGIVDSEGICTECGRTSDEIIKDVESKSQPFQIPGLIPKIIIKRLQISARVIIFGWLFVCLAPLFLYFLNSDVIFNVFIFIYFIVAIGTLGFHIFFLIYINRLANALGKNGPAWVFFCFGLTFLFQIYAYHHLMNQAKGKVDYSK